MVSSSPCQKLEDKTPWLHYDGQTLTLAQVDQHPLLSSHSLWAIKGNVLDAQGNKQAVEGEWITRTHGVMKIYIYLRTLETNSTLLERICTLSPSQNVKYWSEQRNLYGNLQGQISVVEDSLLLQLDSSLGLRSLEVFLRVFAEEYEVRGSLLDNARLLQAWSLGMVRIS